MPSIKKRKVIDADWVDEFIISKIPVEAVGKSEALAKAIKQWAQQKDGVYSLAANTLELDDVYQIFDLKEVEDIIAFPLEEKEIFAIPSEIETVFTKFQSVLGEKHMKNEALARCFVNLLVFSSVLEERSIIQNAKTRPASNPSSAMIPTPTTPVMTNPGIPALHKPDMVTPVALGLYFGTQLKQTVVYEGNTVLLSGSVDYSLGYRQGGTSSGNLVVVEARRRYKIGDAYGQLLSYMAMIHTARKKEDKKNAVVFGVATDGFEYRFWRIDNASSVSRSRLYDWGLPSERQHIYSLLRTVIRAAIVSSPTTSPLKGDDFAKNFDGASHPKFDFGVMSEWQNIFTTDDDPDVEVVEMSRII